MCVCMYIVSLAVTTTPLLATPLPTDLGLDTQLQKMMFFPSESYVFSNTTSSYCQMHWFQSNSGWIWHTGKCDILGLRTFVFIASNVHFSQIWWFQGIFGQENMLRNIISNPRSCGFTSSKAHITQYQCGFKCLFCKNMLGIPKFIAGQQHT